MKKYITIAALLAAGSAFANAADTWTFETKNEANDGGTYPGIAFTLKENSERYDATGTEFPTEFSLSSIDVQAQAGQTIGSNVFIYITDENRLYVGKSENNSRETTAGDLASFSFSDLKLNAGPTYYAFFLTDASPLDSNIQPGSPVDAGKFISQKIAVAGGFSTGTAGELGLLARGTGSLREEQYAPVVTITATAIPEPSAFGLLAGLGALALVGARRRRK